MKHILPRGFPVLILLSMTLFFGFGCASTSVTMQTNKDSSPIHAIKRLFVVLNLGPLEDQPNFTRSSVPSNSESLATSLKTCFSNNAVQVEIKVVNPLELNWQDYPAEARSFLADAALFIRLNHYVLDQFGNYTIIYYDAALSNEITHKLVWRALIKNSGIPGTMQERNQKMAEAIVAQLCTDGFFEAP